MQEKILEKHIGWQKRVLNVFAILVLFLIAAISLQVFSSLLDINPLIAFDQPVVLFGKAITLNSLLDLQWHFLCMIGLLPAGIVWLMNSHVRVDFIYAEQSKRSKAIIELVGHLVFATPFLFMSVPAAWTFMKSAYSSGQGSRNDGLNDLFLVKATLPFGLLLLALVLLYDVFVQLRRLKAR